MDDQLLIYNIASTLLPGIGDKKGKKLISFFGSAEAMFKSKKSQLQKLPKLNPSALQAVFDPKIFRRAEKELEFIKKNKIQALYFNQKNYPQRLLHCDDAPMMLYFKGNGDINAKKIISIVGTRNATNYGKTCCKKIIEQLQAHKPLIVSGLAFGIDICAHENALINKLDTLACLAHGLDRIYPREHRKTAIEMLNQGGLITEFLSETKPDRENFPKRNRIIAGLADATIVVEAGIKGGALITAEIANSYQRDVFAIPGKIDDEYSKGCNTLIKTHKAALITEGKDIEYLLGWETSKTEVTKQTELFETLCPEENLILQIISENKTISIDKLSLMANFSISKTASALLNLELSGLIKVLPGKQYELI